MSFDDATGHAHDLPTPSGRPAAPSIPTRRAPGRPSAAEETPAAQRTVGDILRECECVIFDPEDERMGDVVNRLVPAETRFGIRIRISAGTYKIPFNGMPPLDIGTTLADIINRWGPGKYILELVRLGASEGTTGQPLKSLTQHLQARAPEDVGQEEWPIQWDDPKVTAELKRDRDERRRIRNTPGWEPYSDEDDSNGGDEGGPGGGNFGGGYPEYPDDGRGGPRGQVDFRDSRGGAWSHGGMGPQVTSGQPGYGPMVNPYGQPGMPGAPSGTIATDPNAYPPGTTWVMSPHGLIPQIPAPAAPPPPALTAEALAAAIAAAQPKREPSMLETLLAGIVGSVAVAMKADPLGTIKGMRDALAPVPPPPPPPPPAAPQGPTTAEITLQMQKITLESQLALEKIQRDRDLAMANMQRERDLTLEKIQRENEARLRDMEARQSEQRAKDQIAALQAQLNAMRGQDNDQSKALKAQIADLTKQVSAAQRSANAASDPSFIEKMLSGPMGEPIVGILGKVADKFLSDAPTQPAPQYPQGMPTGVPAMPQMQPQWAPEPAPQPQYAPAPQAQWAPEHAPQPQWAPDPQYAPTPAVAPVQDFLPGVDPVAPVDPEQSPGMPPFDADAPVAQDAPADPPTSDEEPSR